MTALAIAPPFPVFQDVDGSPLTDGYVYVGTSGLNPQTNPLTIYWDAALTQLAAQPLRTSGGYIVNSGSVARVFTAASGYSLVVRNKNGALVWSTLSIAGGGVTTVDSALVVYAQTAAELAAGITPTNTFWPSVQRDAGNIKRFGAACDGVTDDTVAFQRAINSAPATGGYIFVPGDMLLSSQILIQNKKGLTIEIERFATITFTDGAYIGLFFQGGNNHKILGGQIYGSNHAAPTITLVKVGNAGNPCPLFVSEGVVYSYAATAMLLANTYETRLRANAYSNCDVFVKASVEGSSTDIELIGETFGSSTIGTSYLVDIKSNGTRITDCYWETTSHTKGSLAWRTGAQLGSVTGGQLQNSGEVLVETSNSISFTGLTCLDSYDSVNLRTFRVLGGGDATFAGCAIKYAAITAGVAAISASGGLYIAGGQINKADIGINGGSQGVVSGMLISGCTTGVNQSAGSALLVQSNYIMSNTTGVLGNSTTATVVQGNVYSSNGTNVNINASTLVVKETTFGSTAGATDGQVITHGHIKTPARVLAQGTTASQFVSVTALGATTFTIAIKKDDGTAGTAQTVYWEVNG